MRVAIYARKSKYTGVGESIGNQIEMCKQYINNMNLQEELEVKIYEDEGYSGKNLSRPNFQEMMRDNERQSFDIVIVYGLDRISRSVCDFMTLIEKYNETNTKFISLAESFDTSSPMGKAMISICAVFAQLERETIAARIHDNMQMMAQSGYWTGGTTPLGYVSKDDKEEQKNQSGDSRKLLHKHHILQVDDENDKIVKLIYNLFLQYKSCKAVEKYLIEYGYKTRKDTYFDDIAIKRILTNPVYCEVTSEAIDYFNSISLRKLAEKCNVSYTALKKWLNNLCSPKYELYQRVFKDFYINIYIVRSG